MSLLSSYFLLPVGNQQKHRGSFFIFILGDPKSRQYDTYHHTVTYYNHHETTGYLYYTGRRRRRRRETEHAYDTNEQEEAEDSTTITTCPWDGCHANASSNTRNCHEMEGTHFHPHSYFKLCRSRNDSTSLLCLETVP